MPSPNLFEAAAFISQARKILILPVIVIYINVCVVYMRNDRGEDLETWHGLNTAPARHQDPRTQVQPDFLLCDARPELVWYRYFYGYYCSARH